MIERGVIVNEIELQSTEDNTGDIVDDSGFDIGLRDDINIVKSLILSNNPQLTEFEYYAEVGNYNDELNALNGLIYHTVHLYNLVLTLFLFLICKWLLDKIFILFNSMFKRW